VTGTFTLTASGLVSVRILGGFLGDFFGSLGGLSVGDAGVLRLDGFDALDLRTDRFLRLHRSRRLLGQGLVGGFLGDFFAASAV